MLTSEDGATITTLPVVCRARLLTLEDRTPIIRANSNKTPMWLYTNLSTPPSTTGAPIGYWLLTSFNSNGYMADGYVILFSGNANYMSVYSEEYFGVRPVITISK